MFCRGPMSTNIAFKPISMFLNAAFVNAADYLARATTLDAVFFEAAILEQRPRGARVSPH